MFKINFKLREVIVVGHQESGDYLYLIVENKEFGTFDIIVTPEVYNRLKKGDKTFFNLREIDIKQTPRKNIIFFFGQVLLWEISAVIIFVLFIFLIKETSALIILKHFKKKGW